MNTDTRADARPRARWRGPARLLAIAIAALPALAPASGACDEPKAARPSFLLILVDDLGARDLGCTGSPFHETPELDRFARSALRFTQAYASHPVCSPTRAALLTGKNPARLRITDWIPGADPKNRKLRGPQDRDALPLSEVTIAEELRAAGYRTFFAGKWHLGGEGHLPEDQGFEINVGGFHRGSPPGGYYVPYKNPKLPDGPPGEYLTDRLAGETIRFLRSAGDAPFFIELAFYTVHAPIQPCKRHVGHFEEKRRGLPAVPTSHRREHDGWTKLRQDDAAYASMVRAMDENVGRLLAALESTGRAGDCVVIFTSDNGGLSTLRRKRAPTSNEPLRAGKGWCYEGGIRVPLIVRAPGVTRAGSTCAAPVWSADVPPTILELAGLPPAPERHRDGVSIAPLLRGGDTVERREPLVWHYPHYHGSTWTPGSAIRSGRWKLIEFYETGVVELYDLERDPSERHDLAGKEAGRARELRRKLRRYLESVDAQMPQAAPASSR